jgi:deoxyribodipyrimidine photolyase-related protein
VSRSNSPFLRTLAERQNDPAGRRWIYIPYDQVTDQIGPLAQEDPRELGIILIENPWKAKRRPYHRQKIALVIANLRQFALEQAARGVAIKHIVARTGRYANALEEAARKLGPLRVMTPAERELRIDLSPLVERGLLSFLPHEGWLTTAEQFRRSTTRGLPVWKMDSFYRLVRRETGILMNAGKPIGGKFSFDAENRKRWTGDPPPPPEPTFPNDPIKSEVAELIETHFTEHPGKLDLDHLPSTADDAETLWRWAKHEALPHFGPFEDAMSRSSQTLFHTRLSAIINIHRLTPARVVREAENLPIDLASKEGFIRQILGWREFVKHVHDATDGFRSNPLSPKQPWPIEAQPLDAGFGRWKGHAWNNSETAGELDGGASPTFLPAANPLPNAFWGAESGLACLDHVVGDVWKEGYSHHITRLMVLANIASLLDVSPRELTDWFWIAYIDAYDWVVEPNVLGMGTFAVGPVMTTKPYIAGSAYIARMSDYCQACKFDPKRDCPLTRLYWAYLQRHANSLAGNPRLALPLKNTLRRSKAEKSLDKETFRIVTEKLTASQPLSPSDFVSLDTLKAEKPSAGPIRRKNS